MLSFYFYIQPPKCKCILFVNVTSSALRVSGEKIMTNQYTIVSGGIFLHIYTSHGKQRLKYDSLPFLQPNKTLLE